MSNVIPVPRKWIYYLRAQQILAVKLKDGRCFDQVVASEGRIIQVRGYNEVPFTPEEVMSVEVNHRHWNFRDLNAPGSATGNCPRDLDSQRVLCCSGSGSVSL